MTMHDCESLLEQLSDYLDGLLTEAQFQALQQRARQTPCYPVFQAMLDVHTSLLAAPMIEPSHDLSHAVVAELDQRAWRERLVVAAVLGLGILAILTPLLLITWLGAALYLDPSLFPRLISWMGSGLGDLVAYGIAILTAWQHLPGWVLAPLFTFLSLSLLLISLAIASKKHPELVFARQSVQASS